MARAPQSGSSASVPTSPTDLYDTTDIRFVMREVAKLSTQVDRLIQDVGKHGEKLDDVRHQISFVKGAVSVIGGLIVIFGGVAVWYFKGKIGG